MQYARDKDGILIYPTEGEFHGVANWEEHDKLLRRARYMPLHGDAPEREGYAAKPKTWHVVTGSETHVEPRQGEDGEMHDTPIEVDTSYFVVDEWDYEPLPPPEPEVVRYSKYKIQLACQSRGLWEQLKEKIAEAGLQDSWSNIVDISSDNDELKNVALPALRAAFGSDVVDAVLAESIAE